MIMQVNVNDVVSAIQSRIENVTELRCYDIPPKTKKSPFYFVEYAGSEPTNSKTTYRTTFRFYIHAISAPKSSNVELYDMIAKAEKAFFEDLVLSNYDLIMQTYNGVINRYDENETNEKHAVMSFELLIGYGVMAKV